MNPNLKHDLKHNPKKLTILISILAAILLLLSAPFLAFSQVRPLAVSVDIQTFNPQHASNELDSILSEFTSKDGNPDNTLDRLSIWVYTIRKGDTPIKIANKFGLDLSTLFTLNDVKEDGALIITGHPYRIANQRGILHKVRSGESLASIARKYEEFNVTVEKIRYVNDLDPAETLRAKQKLFIPGAELPLDIIDEILEKYFDTPLSPGYRLTSRPTAPGQVRTLRISGRTIHSPHNGIDLAQPMGSRVVAPRGGTVVFAGWNGGYGKLVKLSCNHPDFGQIEILFGHLSSIEVSVGQHVSQGQLLGKVGSTGRSTGPHLHLEVRQDSMIVNPLAVFRDLKKQYGNPTWTKRSPR